LASNRRCLRANSFRLSLLYYQDTLCDWTPEVLEYLLGVSSICHICVLVYYFVIGVLRFALTLDLILLQVLGDEEKRERYDRGEDLEEQHGGGQGFHQGFHGGGQTFSFQFEGGFPGGGFHF
jgi:hypothetical protein